MPVEGFRGDLKPSVMTSFSPLTRGHFHASSNLQMISSLVCCCERQVRSPLFIRTFSDGKWTVMNEIVYMFTSFALCMCKWLSFLYHLISVLIWEKKKKIRAMELLLCFLSTTSSVCRQSVTDQSSVISIQV